MSQVKTLLSKSVHNRLSRTLLAIHVAKTVNERNNEYDKLRDQLAKLFSLKIIGQYPNQVMEDFAETLQGLYAEKDDLSSYLFHIQNYLHRQIQSYDKISEQLTRKLQNARRQTEIDPITLLDIEYQAWTYSHGYYKQQREMYRYLLNVSAQILEHDRVRAK